MTARQLVFDWATGDDLVAQSIEIIKANQPADCYHGAFSGGKDSILLRSLTERAGARVRWYYANTTIDPPELLYFIRRHYHDVVWVKPRFGNFFRRVATKATLPTRRCRWCCAEYKEMASPKGATVLTGIRAEESPARARRGVVATNRHHRTGLIVNPVLHWDSETLWDYLDGESIATPSLYREGFHRLGCVGCPLSSRISKRQQFERWPRYRDRWRGAVKAVWGKRSGSIQRDGRPWYGDAYFDHWEDMWSWYVNNRSLPLPKAGGLF